MRQIFSGAHGILVGSRCDSLILTRALEASDNHFLIFLTQEDRIIFVRRKNVKLKPHRTLQTIVNATLEHYSNQRAERVLGRHTRSRCHAEKSSNANSLKKQRALLSARLHDLLPHSSQGWRSQCV